MWFLSGDLQIEFWRSTGMFAMTCTLFFFLALPVQEAKLIIDNNRVTVHEVRIPALSERKGKPLTIGARGNDVVAIDLDRTTAYFVPKGTTHPRPQHGIVTELKNMSNPESKGAVDTLSLAETLSWAIRNANRSVSKNSPCTGSKFNFRFIRRNASA